MTSIGERAFYCCSGLSSITFPNSVTSIGNYAFEKCSSMTSVTIGNSVTIIGKEAFLKCSNLTSVTIPNSVTSIERYAFYECSDLTSVTIGNSVASIGNEAFYKCSGLASVTIPNSVTSIGGSAFQSCSGLTSITIGIAVKNIYNKAFASCKELSDVYCFAEEVPSTNTDAFQESYIEYANLHVPAASLEAYKAVEPWKNFKNKVALNGETPVTPDPQKCATPTIAYVDGKLKFDCETEGVEFVSEIKSLDAKMYNGNEISLTPTYEVSVYATKADYENSDVATATITWRNGSPKMTGFSTVKMSVDEGTGDVNGDQNVDVADIATIIDIMAARARMQEETEE